jgi:hypothetical protein
MVKGDVLEDEWASALGRELEQVDDEGDVGHPQMINTST